MRELNEKTAGKIQHPERVIQFGEGNFFVRLWIGLSRKMNEKVGFNSSVGIQPIDWEWSTC